MCNILYSFNCTFIVRLHINYKHISSNGKDRKCGYYCDLERHTKPDTLRVLITKIEIITLVNLLEKHYFKESKINNQND